MTDSNNQVKYVMTITADSINSTDNSFDIDNLRIGGNYKPLKAYFEKGNGEIIERKLDKGERRISNKTLPRIACQVFEEKLAGLSVEAREAFPICKYDPESDYVRGIFSSVTEFKEHYNTYGHVDYKYGNGRQFIFFSWNTFSTIIFAQECLKRFGNPDDKFILIYRDRGEKETEQDEGESTAQEEQETMPKGFRNPYSPLLIESRNIIFRGAPGTGKTYLANEIAADIISDGYYDKCKLLDDEQKQQVEFVQFHPSYDYTDFVEGIRPEVNAEDGTLNFRLRDGVFKQFVDRARKNFENAENNSQEPQKYIFIIDEINRGEISKIFGELFFSIAPENRGRNGEVSTQYANMHKDPGEKFYIPENVYIIGTMNDIDRSVDSFDFAMRRRFRFVEIKPEDRLDMLDTFEDDDLRADAIERMTRLNNEIVKVEDLNENYQIGAAYFLKLKTLTSEQLWTDHLRPLLQEYVQGMYEEEEIMNTFAKAYGFSEPAGDSADEVSQD